ncbi:MAG: serine hydrolase [Burkholderiales bacterium]|nr:serine hydrolase [Anaerolineae bacterium]
MASGLSGKGTKRRGQRLPLLPIISFTMLAAAVSLFVLELVGFSQQQTRLPGETLVADVNVGSLLPSEGRARWEQAYAQPLALYYADSPILLDPAGVGFRVNSEVMLAAARSAMDVESGFWQRFSNYLLGQESEQAVTVPLTADYQSNLLEQFIRDIATRYDRPPGDADYNLESLSVGIGSPGYVLDVDAALPLVDAALRNPENRRVNLPIESSSAANTDIGALERLIRAYLIANDFPPDGPSSVASVYIMDLQTGEEISINGDVTFSAASIIKVAILIDYFRSLTFAPTSDEAWLMANSLLCSNNSSSNLIMQIIGGNDIFAGIADVTNNLQFIGARNTFITAPFDLGIEGQELGSIPAPITDPNPAFNTEPDPYNQITAEDVGGMFNMIYDCANYGSGLMAAYPDGEFTPTECQQMLELMSVNDLLRLLQGGLPPDTRISHKNGWVADTHGDAGIVYPPNGHNYIIAVFLWEDVDFLDYNRGWPIIEGVSRATWNYFSPETPMTAPRTDLPIAAQECEGNYLPPGPDAVNLNDMRSWRTNAPVTEPDAADTTTETGDGSVS